MTRRAKGPLQAVAGPVVGYFDRRFQEMYDRIDDRLAEAWRRVETEVETISEMTLGMQRFVDVAGQELGQVAADLREVVAELGRLVDRLEREPPAGSGRAEPESHPTDAAET